MMKRILIIGATSAIASACARLWAAQGARFFLVGRDARKLEALAGDLSVRGAAATGTWQMDAVDVSAHPAMVEAGVEALGGFDIALIAHGTLPNQPACEGDAALTLREFTTNGTSVIALLTILASLFEQQHGGAIAVITSVAGDRGRPSNYVYGSAKAAVSVFCEGLRARLFRAGVSLTDIRPGFVATPMTQGLPLPAALVAQPEAVARRILAGIEHGKDILYVPAFWALIMGIIRNIPRSVFKRMKL
jgi:short-subunit dehydrogenase